VLKALFSGARSGGPVGTSAAARGIASAAQRAEPVLAGVPAQPKVSKAKIEPIVNNATASESNIAGLVRRLVAKRPDDGGHRTLITGETSQMEPGAEALELSKALADTGATVVLVDWSPSGRGMPGLAGSGSKRGLTELLTGDISFDEAVNRVPGSTVHFIGCGAPIDESADDIDPDQLNLVLDALDEAYDHIIVAGNHDDARLLFEVIQGRFDAGVLVADAKKRASALDDPNGTFLGFEVADIDVICLERAGQAPVTNQRILRATQKGGNEARSV
jgi:succinoglycan biosynthesis transport protein ExoP